VHGERAVRPNRDLDRMTMLHRRGLAVSTSLAARRQRRRGVPASLREIGAGPVDLAERPGIDIRDPR
jgi:hypothetical protein